MILLTIDTTTTNNNKMKKIKTHVVRLRGMYIGAPCPISTKYEYTRSIWNNVRYNTKYVLISKFFIKFAVVNRRNNFIRFYF